jgi:hypothetical protein
MLFDEPLMSLPSTLYGVSLYMLKPGYTFHSPPLNADDPSADIAASVDIDCAPGRVVHSAAGEKHDCRRYILRLGE